jgi:hypothetical protein
MSIDPAIEIRDVYEIVAAGAQPRRRDVRGTHPAVDVLLVEEIPGEGYRLALAKATLTISQTGSDGEFVTSYAWSDLTVVFPLVIGLASYPGEAELTAALARIDEIVAEGATYMGALDGPLTLA